MAEFYEVTLASVRLWCASFEADQPRTLVGYAPARGDMNEFDDVGAGEHKTTVELLFADMPNEPKSGLDRFRDLKALVDAGNPEEGYYFSHPIDGTFRVKIGDFRYSYTDGRLTATASLTRVGTRGSVASIGPAVSPDAGAEAVQVAADNATRELAAVGLTAPSPAAAAAAAERWSEVDVAPRSVFTELGTESQRIEDDIAKLNLLGDLEFWGAYKSLVDLRHQLTAAADAATAEVAEVFSLFVSAARPLRTIIASVYGSAAAREKFDQVAKLNDISTPARITPGTVLLMPAPDPTPRRV